MIRKPFTPRPPIVEHDVTEVTLSPGECITVHLYSPTRELIEHVELRVTPQGEVQVFVRYNNGIVHTYDKWQPMYEEVKGE